jgi:hypothetical protein
VGFSFHFFHLPTDLFGLGLNVLLLVCHSDQGVLNAKKVAIIHVSSFCAVTLKGQTSEGKKQSHIK